MASRLSPRCTPHPLLVRSTSWRSISARVRTACRPKSRTASCTRRSISSCTSIADTTAAGCSSRWWRSLASTVSGVPRTRLRRAPQTMRWRRCAGSTPGTSGCSLARDSTTLNSARDSVTTLAGSDRRAACRCRRVALPIAGWREGPRSQTVASPADRAPTACGGRQHSWVRRCVMTFRVTGWPAAGALAAASAGGSVRYCVGAVDPRCSLDEAKRGGCSVGRDAARHDRIARRAPRGDRGDGPGMRLHRFVRSADARAVAPSAESLSVALQRIRRRHG